MPAHSPRGAADAAAVPHHVTHLRRSTRYLLISLLPLLLCWLLIMQQSHQWAMSITRQNATNMLEKNSLLIEQRLSTLSHSVYALGNDITFNELVLKANGDNPPNVRATNRDITDVFSRYFWDFDGACSFYLLSPRYSFCYYNSTGLPDVIVPEYVLYMDAIREAEGKAVWFPTARYSDVIYINERYSKYYSDYEVISLGAQMNLSYYQYGFLHQYSGDLKPPVILISLFSSVFDQWLSSEHMLADTSYRIYTNERALIYASQTLEDDPLEPSMMPVAADMDASGQLSFFQDGDTFGTFVCSCPLSETGWILTSYTPVNKTMLYFSYSISYISLIVIVFTIVLVFVVLKTSVRGISQPLALLSEGLDQTAVGNYAHRIQCTQYPNYRTTFDAYNSMNEHIDRLIAENYEVKLSEKELEIQLINIQFNPHFLYNMLNTISLMSLENGQMQVSDMLGKLAYMMRYSVKKTTPIVPFGEDLRYIEAYISAMQLRTNGNFDYVTDIDPELLTARVPKFMLQPFVENAILHGFSSENPDFSYTLRITARRDGDDLLFTVEDNGSGMDEQVSETLWAKDSAGIGIANTHKRIQLYYGAEYGVRIQTKLTEGTVVTVRIPRGE